MRWRGHRSGRGIAVLAVTVAALVGAGGSSAAPVVGANVNVSKNGANIGEAAVAVDPSNAQRLFVSGTTGLYRFSSDGGATWKTPATTFTTDGGDTNSSWDSFGNLFVCYLDTGVFATPKNG